MENSKNKKVQKFLDDLMMFDEKKFDIIQKLRKVVFKNYLQVSERIIYGGIMFSIKEKDFGGIFAYKNHISFEFSDGYKFKDSKKILQGGGKFRRHLKIEFLDDIKDKEVTFFVKQAISIL